MVQLFGDRPAIALYFFVAAKLFLALIFVYGTVARSRRGESPVSYWKERSMWVFA